MKIGLLTYHHSCNYGAILQSYATARVLQELGHSVEFINIQQPERKSIIGWAYYFRQKHFNRFMAKNYPRETSLIKTVEDLKSLKIDYDCIMVGSDQTWNPIISKDKYQAYFLNFGPSDIKRLSYASSFGFDYWPESFNSIKEDVYEYLKRFDSISVRETSAAKLLKDEFNLDSTVVADPTMLLSSYEDIVGIVKPHNNIVCYFLNRTNEQFEFARRLGKEQGKKPVLLNSILPTRGFSYLYPPSIEKWIQGIGGADCVVTDSFHGVVFSILQNTNFIVVAPNVSRMCRLYDLMKTLGIENRYFTGANKAFESKVWEKPINWDEINKRVLSMRIESLNFLKNNLP